MATKQQQQLTLRDQLAGDAFKDAIAEVLPEHCTPDRMVRTGIAALNRVPKLKNCTPASFFKCMMDLSQWGLEPDGRRAHLIPYGTECTLIIDYKGLVELAYRSGVVSKIHADVIHAGDLFRYNKGEVIEHVPWFIRQDARKPEQRGEVIAAYCEVKMKDGAEKTELMERDDIESIRRRSRAGTKGPWVTDWNEMAKKTAFRRVSKWLPLSAEIRDAIERDGDQVGGVVDAPAVVTAKEFKTMLEPMPPQQPMDDRLIEYDVALANAPTVASVGEIIAEVDSLDDLPGDIKDDLATMANQRIAELEAAS